MMRVGIGYDVHPFGGPPASGKRPLRLGGITVPCPRGLAGHSDADVLLHAVADALFGAIAAPDLGEQFPSSRARYRNADSRTFVRSARGQIRRQGWAVGNLDATVIADAPKLAGYKRRMSQVIGGLLEVDPSRVSVKAKTTETFCPGEGGIAAHVVVLLEPVGAAPRRRGRKDR